MALTHKDVRDIFQKLHSGTVPERNLETFAVGVERPRGELHRLLELVREGSGEAKFLRGGYGCGKTFLARLAAEDAQARGFATSFVVVSDNDLHFHKFDELYRKVVSELATSACPRGALNDVLDRWVARVEDALVAGGADDSAPDFDAKVQARLEEELASRTQGSAPEDFGRVVRTIFALKQEGRVGEASALVGWLSGSGNVAAGIKKLAGIKGEISSAEALQYLRGILEVVKAAGYRGLVIIIDEAETILRMKADVRGKSLNGIRQILDASGQYPGLLWLFTGTPDFFDTTRGVQGLQPLHDRIRFQTHQGLASLKQPQLELRPFDAARLREVALKLRALFPATDRASLERRVTPAYIEELIAEVTRGFKGDVGVVPRQFLRTFSEVLDLTDENPDFVPEVERPFKPRDPSRVEEARLAGRTSEVEPEPGDERGYAVEF